MVGSNIYITSSLEEMIRIVTQNASTDILQKGDVLLMHLVSEPLIPPFMISG